jgi:hypothetical protein
MANELATTVKLIAEKAVAYVGDAATLTVETSYVQVGPGGTADFAQARPVASTVIRLDGDSRSIMPVRQLQNGTLELDADLYNMHLSNVRTAIEYRSQILKAVLNSLQSLRG